MPGAAQCGSSRPAGPRRRFRDTEPIINQRDADRQRSARVHGMAAAGHGRTVAILPAHARVGLLTDCQGSSDQIARRHLPCRRSVNRRANRRLIRGRRRMREAGRPRLFSEQVDESAREARQRIEPGNADLAVRFRDIHESSRSTRSTRMDVAAGEWPIVARSRTTLNGRPRPVAATGICVPSCVWRDARHRASRPGATRVAEAVVQRR